jgi:hypothetical protein
MIEKHYVAQISQNGSDALLVSVMENTFGATLTWERNNSGVYVVNSDNAFPLTRTVINQQWGAGADSQHWLPIFDFNDPEYVLGRYWKAVAVNDGNQLALYCIGLDGNTTDLNASLVLDITVYSEP